MSSRRKSAKSAPAAAPGSTLAAELTERGFEPGLDSMPIYFISTHGAYDLRNPEGGKWDEAHEFFEVPAGVHIFETMQMGELCLTTIDQYLWTMAQGNKREVFLRFFLTGTGAEDFEFTEHTEDGYVPVSAEKANEIAEQVFHQLYYYGPGTRIARRTLSIGGGRREEAAGEGQETLRRDYINMGFYKFPLGAAPNAYPNVPRRGLPASRIPGLMQLRTEMVESSEVSVTSDEILRRVAEVEGAEEGVFIFTSCAQIWREDDETARENKRRIGILERVQHEAAGIMAAKSIPFRPGGPGKNVSKIWWSERRALEHRMKAIIQAQEAAAGGTEGSYRGRPEFFAPEKELEENITFADSENANANLANIAPAQSMSKQPAGTAVYYKITFADVKAKPRQVSKMIPIIAADGSPYLTVQALRLALRTEPISPDEYLYRFSGAKGSGKHKLGVWHHVVVTNGRPECAGGACAGKSAATRRGGRRAQRRTYKNY